MTAFRIPAPAKLNFFLHITGKRPDGYHELESLAGFTVFGDVLEFAPAPELSLTIEGPFAGLLQTDQQHNLVLRAARALQEYAGVSQGASIALQKNIPMGAGLGGGSCDAAAALKGLMQLWQLSVPDTALQSIALSLGSDVPVCLVQQNAWVSGTGDEVHSIAGTVTGWVVLVNPNVPLLTADVYRRFKGSFAMPMEPVLTIHGCDELIALMQRTHNALEEPAIEIMPVIGALLSQLRNTHACRIARMSGSGATCYALYDNETDAQQAAINIRANRPECWIEITPLAG